ncbi:alpha/beta hydrolase [Georgenia sp. H159]|uniref:alpha/beta fold hydrolase n=1 Tax=Georgenia sp. H159 TaxID=3076115 RepID=UPI002D78F272|nr:alpha/beta hydrolase [Georgenia sp. H159]
MNASELGISGSADEVVWSPPLPEAAGFEHLVVETPGLRTHLAAVGEGEPVLFLHGMPQHWWQWRTVAPAIAAAGYRALCPDLRGQGWTAAANPRVERESRLHDVLTLLDALHLDRVHVVSHDLGSVTAMQLSYDHPARVRAAVQLAVPPAFMTFHPKVAPGFRHLPQFIWHRPGASLHRVFSEGYLARPMPPETVAAHLAQLHRPEVDAAVRPLTRKHLLPEAMRMTAGHYRRQRLTVPTRFVFGRQDRYWNEQVMGLVCRHPERYAERVDFAYVDGASHFITDDAPEAVADLALDWFGRAA